MIMIMILIDQLITSESFHYIYTYMCTAHTRAHARAMCLRACAVHANVRLYPDPDPKQVAVAPRAARVRLCVRELTAAAVAVRKENNMRARIDFCKSVPARAALHAGALSAD